LAAGRILGYIQKRKTPTVPAAVARGRHGRESPQLGLGRPACSWALARSGRRWLAVGRPFSRTCAWCGYTRRHGTTAGHGRLTVIGAAFGCSSGQRNPRTAERRRRGSSTSSGQRGRGWWCPGEQRRCQRPRPADVAGVAGAAGAGQPDGGASGGGAGGTAAAQRRHRRPGSGEAAAAAGRMAEAQVAPRTRRCWQRWCQRQGRSEWHGQQERGGGRRQRWCRRRERRGWRRGWRWHLVRVGRGFRRDVREHHAALARLGRRHLSDSGFSDDGAFLRGRDVTPPKAYRASAAARAPRLADGRVLLALAEHIHRDLFAVSADPAGGATRCCALPRRSYRRDHRPTERGSARFATVSRSGRPRRLRRWAARKPTVRRRRDADPWLRAKTPPPRTLLLADHSRHGAAAHNNVYIHHHRKGVMDSDNNVPPGWRSITAASHRQRRDAAHEFGVDGRGDTSELSGKPFYAYAGGVWQASARSSRRHYRP